MRERKERKRNKWRGYDKEEKGQQDKVMGEEKFSFFFFLPNNFTSSINKTSQKYF